MRKHAELILKIVSAVLGAALLFHITLDLLHANPLAKVSIPPVPTLAASTNASAPAKSTNTTTALLAKSGTNVSPRSSTNLPPRASTNAITTNNSTLIASKAETNSIAILTNSVPGTNSVVPVIAEMPATNSVSPTNVETNSVNSMIETNALAKPSPPKPETNFVAGATSEPPDQGTNRIVTQAITNAATNLAASVLISGTNVSARGASSNSPAPLPRPQMTTMMGMSGMPGMGGKKLPELSPATKARVDRIYESELFGQVMRPMPAALMGIAGNMAILRSSTGQTGLVKEGDSLGDMKLVRIGVNRVLVEEGGTQKELMIFNGYGGESLLSKKETPDETTPK